MVYVANSFAFVMTASFPSPRLELTTDIFVLLCMRPYRVALLIIRCLQAGGRRTRRALLIAPEVRRTRTDVGERSQTRAVPLKYTCGQFAVIAHAAGEHVRIILVRPRMPPSFVPPTSPPGKKRF